MLVRPKPTFGGAPRPGALRIRTGLQAGRCVRRSNLLLGAAHPQWPRASCIGSKRRRRLTDQQTER
jgi:hypothetical protein